MKHFLLTCVCTVSVSAMLFAQSDAVKDYSRTLATSGLTLTFVHLNDKTAPVLFQPPTLYAMRARARDMTVLYVQGTPDHNVEIDTTTFTIDQAGATLTAVPTSIKNFTKGKIKIASGERIDGLLTFDKLVDSSKPFTLHHGRDSVEFKFTPDQVKALAPAPAAQ